MQLTTEQQELVKTASWVVNTVLKRLNRRGDEDLRQEAMLFMCDIATKWALNKGRKWTSYAYQRVYYYVLHKVQKDNAIRRREVQTSELPDREMPAPDDNACFASEIIDELYRRLNEAQREVLYLRVQGCSHKDISAKLGISYKRVTQIAREIKREASVIRSEWSEE